MKIRSDYKDCDIVVHPQVHPGYPPWVGLITYNTKEKVYMWNVEGQSAQETLQKCRNFIDENPLLE